MIAVEPTESPLLSAGTFGPHKIQGIGANFVPDVLDREVYDEVLTVSSEEAFANATRTGDHVKDCWSGISSGAAAKAAKDIASRPESAGKTIVVIFASAGERYLSTLLFQELREKAAALTAG